MDHRRMLGWAERSLDALEISMRAFHGTDPYQLWGDVDKETGERLLRVRVVDVAHPEDWAFQVGDIIHNLRVALDYVAFAHAYRLDNSIAADTKRLRNVQFPICAEQKDWSGTLGRLAWASDGMRSLFESLQPYHRPDLANLHPLLMLHRLDNPHKHQSLLRSAPNVTAVNFTLRDNPPEGSVQIVGMGVEGQFKDGAVIARVRFNRPVASGHPPTKVDFDIAFEAAFSDGCALAGFPVLPLLRGMADYIGKVVFPVVESEI